MNDDVSAADGLIHAVVVDQGLSTVVFPPNLDAEGIGVVIAGPDHELVGVPVGIEPVVDRAAAFELGIFPALVDHQPIVAIRMEIKSRPG